MIKKTSANLAEIPRGEILSYLGKIVNSKHLTGKRRLQDLLCYIVNQTLEGNQDSIKAYTIALEVFERPATFDATTDTIVRVQAGKLRRCLEWYYRSDGSEDALRIHIPKGSYIPEFVPKDKSIPFIEKDSMGKGRHSYMPRVGVLPFTNISKDEQDDIFVMGVGEQLSSELCSFSGIQVVSYASIYTFVKNGESEPEHAVCKFNLDFALIGYLTRQKSGVTITLSLMDCAKNIDLWSKSIHTEYPMDGYQEIQREIIDKVVPKIADYYGVVARHHYKPLLRTQVIPTSLLEAYFLFYQYSLNLNIDNYLRVKVAFQSLTEELLQDATGNAMFSILALDALVFEFDPNEDWLAKAQFSAYKALQLDQENQQVHAAICYLKMIEGRRNEVIHHAYEILDINPRSAFMKGLAGWYIALAGDYRTGQKLINESIELNPLFPSWFHLPGILKNIEEGMYDQALLLANKMGMSDFYWGPMIRASIYSMLNIPDHAYLEYEKAIALNPHIIENYEKRLSYFILSNELVKKISDAFVCSSKGSC